VVYSLFKKHQRNQREDREEGWRKEWVKRNKIISKCFLQNYDWLGFSFDSILTAVGMTNGVPGPYISWLQQ
jgi:predicted tellurium resistance membrane protein TerC